MADMVADKKKLSDMELDMVADKVAKKSISTLTWISNKARELVTGVG